MEYELSIVATSRNDDHGLNLNERTNAFIKNIHFLSGMLKFKVELIIVEWNPPNNKFLKDVLSIPKKNNFFNLRIITVPPHIHNKFDNSKNLHMFQMIAKNVGIRRARSRFILATNIDIIFTQDFFIFCRKKLSEDKIYRVTRCDVDKDFVFIKDPQRLITKCKNFFITVNSINGSYNLNHIPNIYSLKKFLIYLNNNLALNTSYLLLNLNYRLLKRIFTLSLHKVNYLKLLSNIKMNFFRVKKNIFSNACGDFTLMHKSLWEKLEGYEEWPIFSMHIDSMLLFKAASLNIEQSTVNSFFIYHINHSLGSGYSKEGADKMYSRLINKKIPFIDDDQIDHYINKTTSYNRNPNWGMNNIKFKELNY